MPELQQPFPQGSVALIDVRARTDPPWWDCRSDRPREFVKRRGKDQSRTSINAASVVPSPQVLDRRLASDHDACGPIGFPTPQWAKPGLEASMVSFDPVVGVLVRVVKCDGQKFCDYSDLGVSPVGGDFSRLCALSPNPAICDQ